MLNVIHYYANLDALSLKKLNKNNKFVVFAIVANNNKNLAKLL